MISFLLTLLPDPFLINNILIWPKAMTNMSTSASLLNNAFILCSLRECGFLRGNSTESCDLSEPNPVILWKGAL